MARRPYKKKPYGKSKFSVSSSASGAQKALIVGLIIIILALVYAMFSWLKSSAPKEKVLEQQQIVAQPPAPPQEQWSYIKALETRMAENNPPPVTSLPSNNLPASPATTEVTNTEVTSSAGSNQVEKPISSQSKAESIATAQKAEAQKPAPAQTTSTVVKAETKPVAVAPVVKPEKPAKPQSVWNALDEKPAKSTPAKVTAEKKTEKNEKVEKAEKTEKAVANTNGKKFGLQCGAFGQEGSANNLKGKISGLGLPARVEKISNTKFRVIVSPFNDRAQAQTGLDKLKSNNVSCFIFTL